MYRRIDCIFYFMIFLVISNWGKCEILDDLGRDGNITIMEYTESGSLLNSVDFAFKSGFGWEINNIP